MLIFLFRIIAFDPAYTDKADPDTAGHMLFCRDKTLKSKGSCPFSYSAHHWCWADDQYTGIAFKFKRIKACYDSTFDTVISRICGDDVAVLFHYHLGSVAETEYGGNFLTHCGKSLVSEVQREHTGAAACQDI